MGGSHPDSIEGNNKKFQMPSDTILVILERHKSSIDEFAEYRTISEYGFFWVNERNIEPL